MGWVTPLGWDLEATWRRFLAGDSAMAPTTNFDGRTFPSQFSAEVKDYDPARFLGAEWEVHKTASRNSAFALGAAKLAWTHSGLDRAAGLDRSRVGVYMGSGEGPLDFEPFAQAAVGAWRPAENRLDTLEWARIAYRVMDRMKELEQDPNLPPAHVAKLLGVCGPNFNTLTACAASTQAMGEAVELIREGVADVMVTGGTHSMIHPLGMTGFNRLTALSTRNDDIRHASRPFDKTRDGFVLGEGSGILILEAEEFARARKAKIWAEITGYGSSADAFRITDSHETGRGASAAMAAALADAGLEPKDIDYISAHGTATQENDRVETLAIRNTFGPVAYKVPISSIKSMTGHLIAAAGAVEAITCVLAIRDQILPPTTNYREPDPECDLDYIPNQARPARVRICLSNSFGFGGQNDSLVIRAYEPAGAGG